MGRLFLTVLKRFWVIILSVAIATAVGIGLMANSKADEFGESGQLIILRNKMILYFRRKLKTTTFGKKPVTTR